MPVWSQTSTLTRSARPSRTSEHESFAAERIESHRLLHDKRQTVDALPEVRRASNKSQGRKPRGKGRLVARLAMAMGIEGCCLAP